MAVKGFRDGAKLRDHWAKVARCAHHSVFVFVRGVQMGAVREAVELLWWRCVLKEAEVPLI